MVYRVTGEKTGTEEVFPDEKAGDSLGSWDRLETDLIVEPGKKKALLIGGGIGIPPMLELAKQSTAGSTCEFVSVMGYRDVRRFLQMRLKEHGALYVATEDGSVGAKGNVLDALQEDKSKCRCDLCLRSDSDAAGVESVCTGSRASSCYISMEERMACGIGACLGCVCQSKEEDAHSNVNKQTSLQRRTGISGNGGGTVMDKWVNIAGVALKIPVMTGIRNIWLRGRIQ